MSFLLGYDLGTSSIKACLLMAETGQVLAEASAPDTEMSIFAPKIGWAEQDPERWWQEAIHATQRLKAKVSFDPTEVLGIGITYQMHGLVLVNKAQKVLRPSIIWCDSRAVGIGEAALGALGKAHCLAHFLNAPGNFTASKLRWVRENEPEIYRQIDKMMLPGDYLAMKLTGEVRTTAAGLSEGILWDFKEEKIADSLLTYYQISSDFLPDLVPTLGFQGALSPAAAEVLGLKAGTPISYRAGDQPNNAFSLGVLNAGEVATTAGTSGVVYGIQTQPNYDLKSRINSFLHVNHRPEAARIGVLLCVNGTGILNSWLRKMLGVGRSYDEMNALAAQTPIGAAGLRILPFGNGAERVLENRQLGGTLYGLDFNRHETGHLFRAAQEGIVFALNYGMEVMQSMGLATETVRAGHANLFLSPLFREAFVHTTGATLALFETDGAQGAARAAGVGCGYYPDFSAAFTGLKQIATYTPQADLQAVYQAAYADWRYVLNRQLQS